LHAQHLRPPIELVGFLDTFSSWSSELLHILRPLAYVISLNISHAPMNPLLASATVDLLARALRRTPGTACYLERSEYARRDRDLLWYFLRGDVWKMYTRKRIEKLVTSIDRFPVASLLGHVIQEWILLIDNYFYYTSS